MVTFATVLSGTVADFSAESFKRRLAYALSSVEPEDIAVSVTAASVRVTASITAENASTANSTMNTLRDFTRELLSTVLGGVGVESVEAPTLAWVTAPGAGPSPTMALEGVDGASALASGSNAMLTEHVILLVTIAVAASLLAIMCLICCCYCPGGRKPTRRHKQSIRTFQTFESMESFSISSHNPSISADAVKLEHQRRQIRTADELTTIELPVVSNTRGAAALERARAAKAAGDNSLQGGRQISNMIRKFSFDRKLKSENPSGANERPAAGAKTSGGMVVDDLADVVIDDADMRM